MLNLRDSLVLPVPRIELRLLGSFQLARVQADCGSDSPCPEAIPLRLPTRKIESLLAFLVLYPESHSREKLAALFWGDVPDTQARVSLRYALAMLRKQLGAELLLADRETVQLNPEFPLPVDVRAFQDEINRAKVETRTNPSFVLAPSVIDVYRGDLLADFYDDWILSEREQLRALYLDALLQLIQNYRARSEYARD